MATGVPRLEAPSLNCTVPPSGTDPLTLSLNVTLSPIIVRVTDWVSILLVDFFLTVSEYALLALQLFASVSWTVNKKMPALVGVPESKPEGDKVRPGGTTPLALNV